MWRAHIEPPFGPRPALSDLQHSRCLFYDTALLLPAPTLEPLAHLRMEQTAADFAVTRLGGIVIYAIRGN